MKIAIKREYLVLTLLFSVVLASRLYLSFSVPYFNYDAYFNLRQVEYIAEHGKPLYEDPLSYSGRTLVFPPLFHYILALFNLFMPITLVGRVVPNIFASFLVVVIYLIAKEITKSRAAAIFSSAIAGFIPIFFSKTANSVSSSTLLFPIIFYALYCLLKINGDKKYTYHLIALTFLIPLIEPTAILFVLGLLIYLILAGVENLKQSRREIELIFFPAFVILWIMFLIYKNAFLAHGVSFIWQNTPTELLGSYFKNIHILESVYLIGSIPFVFGIYVVYYYIFREKTRATYIFFGFALATGMSLWLRLIHLDFGLMFLGILLAVLFAQFYLSFFIYLEKTKVSRFHWLFLILLVSLFIATSVLPSFSYTLSELKNSPGEDEINALLWLRDKTEADSVILAALNDGHLINYIAKRKNVFDTNFLLIRNIDQRFRDFNTIFTTQYQTDAVRLLNKYEVSYIYISKNARGEFGTDDFIYSKHGKCFDEAYDSGVFIYEATCTLEEEG